MILKRIAYAHFSGPDTYLDWFPYYMYEMNEIFVAQMSVRAIIRKHMPAVRDGNGKVIIP